MQSAFLQNIFNDTVLYLQRFQYKTVHMILTWWTNRAVGFPVNLYPLCIIWNAASNSENPEAHFSTWHPRSAYRAEKWMRHPVFCTIYRPIPIRRHGFAYNAERTYVNIFPTSWTLASPSSPQYTAQKEDIIFVELIYRTQPTLCYVFSIRSKETFPYIHTEKHFIMYSILLDPTVSIESWFFCATGMHAVHKDGSSLWAMSYWATYFHSQCYCSFLLYKFPLQYIHISISVHQLTQTAFRTMSFQLFLRTPRNSSDDSWACCHCFASRWVHVLAKPDTCPFIDPIALVKQQSDYYRSIVFPHLPWIIAPRFANHDGPTFLSEDGQTALPACLMIFLTSACSLV